MVSSTSHRATMFSPLQLMMSEDPLPQTPTPAMFRVSLGAL